MKISMIAAMGKNRVIGRNNDLPWHLPDDFAFFKEKTKNHHVLMGRKNFESLPHKFRPLPQRTNLILTRNTSFNPEGVFVFHEMTEAIDFAENNNEEELFIIGGGEIYKMGLEIADRIYLTEIDASFEGDTFFPEFNKNLWIETLRKPHSVDNNHQFAFDFVTYDKKT